MKTPVNLQINNLISTEALINKMIESALSETNYVQIVKVVAVDPENLTVNVKPLLLKETTKGDIVETGIVYNVKYVRIQSGDSAIIIDPTVGDIGPVMVCDKDISVLKKNKKESPPGSYRIHSLADSLYLGGVLNAPPTQYIKFSSDGIEIYSPTKITAIAPQIHAECDTLSADVVGDTVIGSNRILLSADTLINLTAPSISLNGALSSNSLNDGDVAKLNIPLESTEEITAKGVDLSTHVHPGVETGDNTTGKPQ